MKVAPNPIEWHPNKRDELEARLSEVWRELGGPECSDELWEFFCRAHCVAQGVADGVGYRRPRG